MADTKNIAELLDILTRVKALLGPDPSPYLPALIGLLGTLIGAFATMLPAFIIEGRKVTREEKSITLAIYAEVNAILGIVRTRGYFTGVSRILADFDAGKHHQSTYQIIVPDDFCIVYKKNINRIGSIDPNLQIKIVQFHQMVDALVQDVKPGGTLNIQPVGRRPFEEALALGSQMVKVGSEISDEVERRYSLKKQSIGATSGSCVEPAEQGSVTGVVEVNTGI